MALRVLLFFCFLFLQAEDKSQELLSIQKQEVAPHIPKETIIKVLEKWH